ncbi:unnamed protein product [Symbiodinium natans]|uniref:Uncharacterized protein n=1 Tax=Symbiodinium natans TaxID=878477 RepID=A0A812NPV3_9DINO|nr:unnamed protein product [Symbiodinium natans]
MSSLPACQIDGNVELCDARLKEIKARMGDSEVPSIAEVLSNIKTGNGPLLDRIFRTLLKAQQAAIAKIFDLRPGAEFSAAIEVAQQRNLPLVCGDRDVDETMRKLKEAASKATNWEPKAAVLIGKSRPPDLLHGFHTLLQAFLQDWWSLLTSSNQVPGAYQERFMAVPNI